MRKQPEVTERTRAALREAFWELYAGDGTTPGLPVERISVRAITDRAGFNRATFYLYFHDYLVGGRGLDDVGADLLCEFYLSGIMAIVGRWILRYPEMPIDKLIGLVTRSVL